MSSQEAHAWHILPGVMRVTLCEFTGNRLPEGHHPAARAFSCWKLQKTEETEEMRMGLLDLGLPWEQVLGGRPFFRGFPQPQ